MQLISRLQSGISRTAVHPQAPRITRCRIPCSASKGEAPEPFIPASFSQPPTPASPSPPSPQPALDKQAALQARVDQAYSSMALTEREPAQRSPVQSPTPQKTQVQQFLFPDEEEMPDSLELPIWDHLEELRERVLVALLAASAAIGACFCFSKELVVFLEAPVADAGVRFLQLSPGEFFFTTLKTAGYTGLLVAAPTVLYEIIAYVVPGLTRSERRFLAPVVFGSSILFYLGLLFSYEVLTPAALNFFVDYANGAVESLWSIDQYFEFVLLLMLSTGLSFQVPVVQVMLGQLGLVSSEQMLSQWRYVVVGSTVVAAVLTPSTDPFTQALLAIPLVGLYMAGATAVKFIETQKAAAAAITGSR